MKRTKIILGIAICLIFIAIWGVCFFSVNRRFPQAERIKITAGDTYNDNGIEMIIMGSSMISGKQEIIKYFEDEQVISMLGKVKDENQRFIYTEIKITNNSNHELNAYAVSQHFMAECEPSAWANGAFSETELSNISCGDSTMIKMVYILNVPENVDISKEEFHLVYRTYPQKIMFVLNV